jgi:hypothetical protein
MQRHPVVDMVALDANCMTVRDVIAHDYAMAIADRWQGDPAEACEHHEAECIASFGFNLNGITLS